MDAVKVGDTRSKSLFEKAKTCFPGGVNSPVRAFEPYPFFIESAAGSRLHSVDGVSYIDYCMAYGALILGHAHREILEAVHRQIDKGTLYGAPTEIEVSLAELIRKLYPSMEKLRLVNSGTEATMHAVRVARGFTGRKKIVKFEGCFHGSHDAVLAKAGSGAAAQSIPNSRGVLEETAGNTIVLPYNDFQALEQAFMKEGSDIAAVILEPVIANAGLILPVDGYLKKLRKLASNYGSVLIFDEVITGFRLSIGGAQQYYGVEPDMTTLGKILGGGFPIAAYGGKKALMQMVAPEGAVYQAGTFSGNPVSAAAGYTVLQILSLKKNEIYSKLEKQCRVLHHAIADAAADRNVDTQVHSLASMFQVFFNGKPVVNYECAKGSNVSKFKSYFKALLEKSVFIPPSQFETCFLSTAHTDEDLQATTEAFDCAMKAAASVGS
jgi:glutamate-1-semialdehyde 2,1-aminomutase